MWYLGNVANLFESYRRRANEVDPIARYDKERAYHYHPTNSLSPRWKRAVVLRLRPMDEVEREDSLL